MKSADIAINATTGRGREFQRSVARSMAKSEESKSEWSLRLLFDGVVAAHPDDGWVNRVENYVILTYPYFHKKTIVVGDRIALGNHHKWRLVEVTKIKEAKVWVVKPWSYYYFREL